MKYVHEREVWWCDFGDSSRGIEISKVRPALILRKFSAQHVFVIPLTRTKKDPPIGYDLSSVSTINGKSYLNISQARAVDVLRLHRKMARLPKSIFLDIKKLSAEVLTPASEPIWPKT